MIRIEPYTATHQVWRQKEDGGLKQEWKQCRVLGIALQDGEPRYVIETYSNGESALELVDSVRTNA